MRAWTKVLGWDKEKNLIDNLEVELTELGDQLDVWTYSYWDGPGFLPVSCVDLNKLFILFMLQFLHLQSSSHDSSYLVVLWQLDERMQVKILYGVMVNT